MSKGYEYSDQEYAAGGNGSVVDAIYHKAKAPWDVGNPYIEPCRIRLPTSVKSHDIIHMA